jgi:transposase
MSTYSIDLRERVLAALDRGMPRSEVVSTFQISLSSLKRWHRARRDTGDCAPKPPSGGPTLTIAPAQDEQVRAQVAAFPDATIAEHTQHWNTVHATSLSPSTIGRAIRRLGLTRKKSR